MEATATIIGAGPAGLAVSVCLTLLSISNFLLEKEDCPASLWKKRSYDRLHLHIAKKFCELPHMPHLQSTPTFMARNEFIDYIDRYISAFNVEGLYSRCVVSALYDESCKKWKIEARNHVTGEIEIYFSRFLIVATGENSKGFIPDNIPGMETFPGQMIHSSEYKCGEAYSGKNVLVVGSGNSGMEISYDLSNWGARTSIVVRSLNHVVTKEMVYLGMWLLTHTRLPVKFVDVLVNLLSILKFGNLSKYGLQRPSVGPFSQKLQGKAPVLDVGTVSKIRSGDIKVVPTIDNINSNMVEFSNGVKQHFDAMIFATGYQSIVNSWLRDYRYIFNEEGMPKNQSPNHWKGEKGIYCIGFSRNGIPGISKDARAVAEDINACLSSQHNEEEG